VYENLPYLDSVPDPTCAPSLFLDSDLAFDADPVTDMCISLDPK
jgi:hypothetical protein